MLELNCIIILLLLFFSLSFNKYLDSVVLLFSCLMFLFSKYRLFNLKVDHLTKP